MPAPKSPRPRPTAKPAIAKEPRGARRRRETRDKLLEAAFRLMAEKGVDGVAINEITETADVGIGSFYNHFESKEAVYAALIDQVFEEFGDALDHLVVNVDDPAEVIAISVRHTLLRARREPLWGRFLVREGLSARVLSRGLGVRLLRDIQKGVAKGRFKLTDPLMSFITFGGGVLGAIAASIEIEGERSREFALLGLTAADLPERAASNLLFGLGLTIDEADAIAGRPLPLVKPASVDH
ncbi:TetR/AcrR family transcriptional regulator [Stagnimonas aquatica]|uniref:TetR/AcrR family transcriptional regulator n=1 Tax=Stagnimonas aquatica TaxID=2689987 RepID=A0A3N0V2N3_9GAMM|nr:TetR/AcrR family transcriptional regulator [Stagnimonas aquatica]ROH86791.1 TetR/AcrR family transcriptional regulator [Stagnimonas aquatica]